ncbi:choline kinase-like protein [Thermochaetoides thermophila DSM 1495]|uniref:Choline kinase-like protein n=1 Tax=Chaetomium thermophilum (strain DSM 1495 / CBS 144.50 / IMI 039719) TaxID=759272 RepID=G0S1N1_CHATD|nr:choline kinase-like protein [Thermochaetoides thermophila DSM 1495]EGS22941.1 choline kinase-like protein [Thermochaetoides thermophila DSM 1495]
MTASTGAAAQPRRSALKSDGDSDKIPQTGAVKAVQIAEPEPSSPDETQVKKQFSAGVAKRLSGRPPLSTASSRSSTVGQVSYDGAADSPASTAPVLAEDAHGHPHPHHRHKIDMITERFMAQVADWVEREKTKRERRKSRKRKLQWKSSPTDVAAGISEPGRPRANSLDSDSSEVSLDRLEAIINENMAAMGLSSIPQHSPRLTRKNRKRSSKNLRTASSDTEWFDGDIVVPSCDAFLDNSKTLGYSGGKAAGDDTVSVASSRKEEKEKQAWITFKNEIIRIAHTLKLKGWRRVPLDGGETISVERLSGALTNAVYVVSPPSEAVLPPQEGKKQPSKVLLRVYGPQVEHLIDREHELEVLRRLARKKIGPRLLGTFLNGRFEQYLNATALTSDSMREPETSKQIAKRMRELHDGVELLDEERVQGPNVWRNWDKWLGQVEKTVLYLDEQVKAYAMANGSFAKPSSAWKARGFVCGVEWPKFKALVEKYRRYLENYYGNAENIRRKLVFAHNDAQYGNILRVRPDNQKSPLLRPANEHKQLVVIDFEYAGANLPGCEFANHFSEWTYNYHDPVRPHACNTSRYPTPEQQLRFIRAYVDHHPQVSVTSPASPVPASATPITSASLASDFDLDSRMNPSGSWREEEQRKEEETEAKVRELMEETRLWRTANSAQWVAWGIVQAKVPGVNTRCSTNGRAGSDGEAGESSEEEADSDEFDYLGYAQERAFFFLGDCVLLGLVTLDELGEDVKGRVKMVNY